VKLLIAEDDPMARRLMQAVLADCDLEVMTAADGHEAVELIEREAPALIVLDWILPGPSGLEVCQRVRQRNLKERPYILMVTFRDADDDVVAAFAAGADDYVTKPFHPRQLHARVKAGMRLLLREHALVQEHAALQVALASLRNMPALVPICSCCRRVSDGEDSWLAADRYLSLRAGVQFTHGLCPTCAPRLMEPKRRSESGMPDFGAEGGDPA
jgi:CheY-like chemotaxis protein